MDKPAHLSPSSAASAARVVDVLVPVALNQAYSYRVPRGMELQPGDVVCVPLWPREVSAGVIDGWVDEGTLATEALPPAPPPPAPDPSFAMPDFSRPQRTAVDAMRTLAANGSFHVALLDGVTGSGKTEVYFEAVAEIIRRGKQSLILMPEIALTGQFLDRFAQRFGVRPLEWHSELTPRTRQRNWAAIAAGEAPVVVGARSALFLPYANLGLIVVDEEHDQAYKQDEDAHYHARDMAGVRAHIPKNSILPASPTPPVETEMNAR